MNQLYPLRPIQIIDTAFNLSKKTFVKFLLISSSFVLPLQIIAWIIEVAASGQESELVGRTIYIATSFQCFIVGASLAFTSNVLGSLISRQYTKEFLGKEYPTTFNASRVKILIIQLTYQFIALGICLITRFGLGKVFDNSEANWLSFFLLFIFVFVWSVFTLRKSFAIPISINENVRGTNLKKRLKSLNKYSFSTLFGTFCYCWLLVLVLATPMLTILQYVIAKDYIKSTIGDLSLLNLIFTFIVSFICIIYSYILLLTYFNGRISHEGFDLAITIDEIEKEGRSRGELLNTNKG